MLSALSIRDIVLIDRLDLPFKSGLSVLTGETGAGKSILLDALGLAIGARADSGLVRHGASQATVTATFEFQDLGPVRDVLDRLGLSVEAVRDGILLLRRVVTADGRSRAFVDDQPVSVGTLRRLGDALVEIQGQFDAHGLLDPATHRQFLDDFAKHASLVRKTAVAFTAWTEARLAHEKATRDIEQAREQEEYLRHAVVELNQLEPLAGEEAELVDLRLILANASLVIEGMGQALEAISGDEGAEVKVAVAQRMLERLEDRAGSHLAGALSALDRASAELREVDAILSGLATNIEADSARLEKVDDRLHALRAVARKHGLEPTKLTDLHTKLAARLEAVDAGGDTVTVLGEAMVAARAEYYEAARALSVSRVEAGGRLDASVMTELPPLRLEKARFTTLLDTLDDAHWSEHGIDRIAFQVATNPGTPFGALNRIASGGELSRFLLALRVALSAANPLPTLIFDEVDAGVGGAVAAAVGERLQKLGTRLQVLVVTHSPQVAAMGSAHWQIAKSGTGERLATTATALDSGERQEEIARMLSGEMVTDEARAAAASLLMHSSGA
ncbi:MAG: DNA repair protein RecN [Alphaproteobacteria bacterium]|nr:DNA repair protein RecN [Alphaproteobacteria bacterium]